MSTSTAPQQKSPRITDAERSAVLAGLDAGLKLSAAASQAGISYGRAYRIANQAGAFDAQRQEAQARKLEAEQRRRDDEARLPILLAAYRRGELVAEDDAAAKVVEALLIKPALDSGNERRILKGLDSLVAVKTFR